MKKFFLTIFALAFFLISINLAFSEETKPQIRKEIVKLNYVKALSVQSLIYTFLSKEGRISTSPQDEKFITISDYPENMEKILAAIKEIDVKPANFLFTVELVLGSENGEEKTDEALKNDPIIKELRTLLRYKNYNLLDTVLVRGIDKELSELVLGKKADFELRIFPKYAKEEKEEIIQMAVDLRQIVKQETAQAEVSTPGRFKVNLLTSHLSLKSGEKTVVGVSKMDGGDKGVILIISGKVVN